MHVAILAMGPSADDYARHAAIAGGRESAFDEVWTCNAFGSVFHADRIFHMDDVRIQQIRADGGNEQIANMLAWMKKHPGPIYTSRALPREPNTERMKELQESLPYLSHDSENGAVSEWDRVRYELQKLEIEAKLIEGGGFKGLVEFPLEDVINATGGMPYFNSTPAYMIGMAMMEKVKRMHLFGLDYAFNDKYRAERGRSCIEYWLGRAIERGIEVATSKKAWLFDQNRTDKLYGYDTRRVSAVLQPDGMFKLTFTEVDSLPTAEAIEAAYSVECGPTKEKPNGKCSLSPVQDGADQRIGKRSAKHQHDDKRALRGAAG